MIILEIEKPGSRVAQFDSPRKNFEFENLARALIDCFYEAEIALNLYLHEKHDYNIYVQKEASFAEEDQKLRSEINNRIRVVAPDKEWEIIDFETNRELKRLMRQQKRVPKSIKHKIIFIHARMFLFSLDNFEKQFSKLVKDEGSEGSRVLYNKFLAAFPNLKYVRDSAHHLEDRIRGERHGRIIDLKPVKNNLINAPNGGALILNSLINDNYGCTLGNGHYGEVEVSLQSLTVIRDILQEFLFLFTWQGPREILP